MQYLKTAISFTANLSTTGALFQTSKRAEQRVSKYIDAHKIQHIVEFGAGHGNVTKTILSKMHQDAKLYVFEINKDFCNVLNEIKDDRLTIINASAQQLQHYISTDVDVIISTIPLSLIPKEIVEDILEKSHAALKKNGFMSQILYSTFHLNKYKRFFKKVSYQTILGLPLEFIYHCQKTDC